MRRIGASGACDPLSCDGAGFASTTPVPESDAAKYVKDSELPYNKIAKKVYRASEVTADSKVRGQIKKLQEDGYGHYPVCVAKTQSSFSTDASLRGAPSGHMVNIREVRLSAGAEFIVMICGDIMTMPGLPKVPSAEVIGLDEKGQIVGLF